MLLVSDGVLIVAVLPLWQSAYICTYKSKGFVSSGNPRVGADAKTPFIVLKACSLSGPHAMGSVLSFLVASVRGFVNSFNPGIHGLHSPTAPRNPRNRFCITGWGSFIIISTLSGSTSCYPSLRMNPKYFTSF